MIRALAATLLSLVLLLVLATPGPASAKRCFPATETCASEAYERKAARAASREADDEFNLDFPPNQWTVVCYRKVKRAGIECSVHTRDTPSTCVGGMTMKKRDGRWRAKNVELSCRL